MDDREILLGLGRLEGKVDALLQGMKVLQKDLEELEGRIRELETSKSFLLGATGVIASGVSMLVSYLSNKF